MTRFSLRQALLVSALFLAAALLVLVTPAWASRAQDPFDGLRPAAPQGEPTASVPPATVSFLVDPIKCRYEVGDVFTVTVQLDNVTNFFGGQLRMSFDPASFQVLDSDPTRPFVQLLPGTLLPPGSFVAPLDNRQVDNVNGTILFGGARLAAGETNDSGSLVLIPFQVTQSSGAMVLAAPPAEVDLANAASQPLPTTAGRTLVIPLRPGQCVFLPHLSVGD